MGGMGKEVSINMKRIRKWVLNRRLKRAIWAIRRVEKVMEDMGLSRTLRRQLWRDFTKTENGRENVIGVLERMRSA